MGFNATRRYRDKKVVDIALLVAAVLIVLGLLTGLVGLALLPSLGAGLLVLGLSDRWPQRGSAAHPASSRSPATREPSGRLTSGAVQVIRASSPPRGSTCTVSVPASCCSPFRNVTSSVVYGSLAEGAGGASFASASVSLRGVPPSRPTT